MINKFRIKILLTLSAFIFAVSGVAEADMRGKTVQYSLGSYYTANGTPVNSGSDWAPAPVSIWLPEEKKTIKNAYLEIDFLTQAYEDITDIGVKFDQGTTAGTLRDSVIDHYSYHTGEYMKLTVNADVTDALAGYFDGNTSSGTFAGALNVAGPDTQAHSMRLYVTYEYDYSSPRHVKTIKYPLQSKTSRVDDGNHSFSYKATVADSNPDIVQQWFDFRGLWEPMRSSKNHYLQAQIGSNNESSVMTLTGSDSPASMEFRYIDHQGNGTTDGFTINTSQAVNLDITRDGGQSSGGFCFLGGEVYLTYISDGDSPSKTRTVNYYLGQSEFADSTEAHIEQLYLAEEEINFNTMYSRITGSFNSGTQDTLSITPTVSGNSGITSGYSLVASAPTVSGFTVFHDFTDIASSWSAGDNIEVEVSNAGTDSKGATGAELVTTYNYTPGSKYSAYYNTFGGQSTQKGISSSSTVSLFWPEELGLKDLKSAYKRIDFQQSAVTSGQSVTSDSPLTTVDIEGKGGITVPHRTQNETHYGTHLYDISSIITPSTTSYTGNFEISSEHGVFSGNNSILYLYTPPPAPPESLSQEKKSGSTISPGEWINEDSFKVRMDIFSPLNEDLLTPKIEIKKFGEDFTGMEDSSGPEYNFTGTPVESTVTVSGLEGGTSYYWQAWVDGAGGSSSGTVFWGYPDSFDVGVDTIPPVITDNQEGDDTWRKEGGTAYDVDFSDELSGLDTAEYRVFSEADESGEQITGW
ncbi:MAG: hypothetical protein ACQEQC_08625, partial [Elusimicrobiota bacterium]